jgi:two-component system response regulator FixJ
MNTALASRHAKSEQWIYVVDDNAEDRTKAVSIFQTTGANVRAFKDGRDFLSQLDKLERGSVVLDIRMPGIDGFSVVDFMNRRKPDWPVIMMSDQSSIPLVVRAMQRGAQNFVEKPCEAERLKDAVTQARSNGAAIAPRRAAQPLEKMITPREMDVLQLLLKGQQNKSIAYSLGISERTVEVHRARLMRRLGVNSFAELIRKAVEHGVDGGASIAEPA